MADPLTTLGIAESLVQVLASSGRFISRFRSTDKSPPGPDPATLNAQELRLRTSRLNESLDFAMQLLEGYEDPLLPELGRISSM
jgi:hypothetical protein